MANPEVVQGLDRVLKVSRKKKVEDAINIAKGLQKCGDIILRRARPLVPVEFGDLVTTGRVETTGVGFNSSTVISFGGVSPTGRIVDYAVIVHEDLTATHAEPTGAKYLSKAINLSRGTCTSLMKRQLLIGGR